MQATGDDGSSSRMVVERVEPGAALGLRDGAGLDGRLDATVGHAGIEALPVGLDRKEPAGTDVYQASAVEEQRQLPREPAVDRCRIRRRSDDATGEVAIGVRERRHVRVEVE